MADQLKNALRNTIKQVRSKISAQYKSASSKQICTRIRSLEYYRNAKKIALYHAVNGEIDLVDIWNSAPLHGKYCYFPALSDNSLIFLPANPKTPFKPNKYGILEPDVSKDLAIPIDDLDIIFLPLVAFDMRCNRIGMGAGYYDRTLEHNKSSMLIGVGYQFQHVDYIEPQPWDVTLDAVITQHAMYWKESRDLND